MRPTKKTWALLDWWWVLASIALIGALAGGFAHIRHLDERSFADAQISASQQMLYADVLRIQENECGEAMSRRNALLPQLCLTVDMVAREATGTRMGSVEAIALAGELDDSCPDRCSTNTLALRDRLKQYAKTLVQMRSLMLDTSAVDLTQDRLYGNGLLAVLCLSLGLFCARLAVLSRRVFAPRAEKGQIDPSEPNRTKTEEGAVVYSETTTV
jgi:hypothetical protein